jgi:hypothetical protein
MIFRLSQLLLIGISLVFNGAVYAAEKTEVNQAQEKISGKVVSVDVPAGTFKLKTKEKDLNVKLESKVQKQSLQKIKIGQTVDVYFAKKDGKVVATKVEEHPGGCPEPPC